MHIVAQRTIEVVVARHLLPRWDLAAHLIHGWYDYHLLVTGRIPWLLWDVWQQGYWPPVPSIYQVPFYVALGGGMAAGLWSSGAAFVLTGVAGSAVLWRLWRHDALLPASLFLALLMSSPFLLAYASVAMTEMLGALAQLVVLLAYVRFQQQPEPGRARVFAVSLSVLFFTKYNYFLMLALPLLVHEWLRHTSGWGIRRRGAVAWHWIRHVFSSPTVALVALYLIVVLIVVRTGGFEFRVFGQRVSVQSVGNSGHVVLYALLARFWYLHRRGRIDTARLISADPRIRPLLAWFVAPVTIWLASPYPNHIRDFVNLVINHPMGEPTVEAGIASYFDMLRTAYFYNGWILGLVVGVFVVSVLAYRHQSPLMQALIITIPVQSAAIAFHQTRFSRFLLITVVLLCLASAGEVGRWLAAAQRRRLTAVLASAVLTVGVLGASNVVTETRFLTVAFEHYTDSEPLREALRSVRDELQTDDRLAFVGHTDKLSPALLSWELGPPAGVACFPFEIGGAKRLDLALATRVLLLVPLGSDGSGLTQTTYYWPQRRAVLARVEQGEFVFRREIPVPDLLIALRLYDRTSAPARRVECR
jgi:hypothetical protein